jgi:hypothetical protein
MVTGLLQDIVKIENNELSWIINHCEHWVYPLQTFIALFFLYLFYKQYPQESLKKSEIGLSIIIGALGFFLWITPNLIYDFIQSTELNYPQWLQHLGITKRDEGFNTHFIPTNSPWIFITLILRFVRLVIVVPIIEELFWRGWFMRAITAHFTQKKWQSIPLGVSFLPTYWITALAIMLIHQPSDYLASFLWATLTYYLHIKTKKLYTNIIAHAVANLILGIYIIVTTKYGFW